MNNQNNYNKKLLKMHLELHRKYNYIVIEDILYNFGERYVKTKQEERNKKLKTKLECLKEKNDTRMKKPDQADLKLSERIVNLT